MHSIICEYLVKTRVLAVRHRGGGEPCGGCLEHLLLLGHWKGPHWDPAPHRSKSKPKIMRHLTTHTERLKAQHNTTRHIEQAALTCTRMQNAIDGNGKCEMV